MRSVYHVGGLAPRVAQLLVACPPRVLHDVVQSESLFWRWFLLVVPFRVTEVKLLFLLFSLDIIFGDLLRLQLGQVHILLSVSKKGHFPLTFFLIPLRVIHYHINLFTVHQHIQNRRKFLNLFLLVPDRIQQLLFFILMFILNVPQLSQVRNVLLLDLRESLLHLVHLLIQVLVVFLDVHQLWLSALLFFLVVFFLFLLRFQLLFEFFYLLELVFIFAVRTFVRVGKHLLQVL